MSGVGRKLIVAKTVETVTRADPENAVAIDEDRTDEIVRKSFGKGVGLKLSVFETVQSIRCSNPDRAAGIACE